MNDNEVKNFRYFKKKLKELRALSQNRQITTQDLNDLLTKIDEHCELDKKDILYSYKVEFVNIIYDLQEEIEFNSHLTKPIKTDKRPYQERAYAKMNYLFRRNKLLGDDEAKKIYSDYNGLNDKFLMFTDLINWLQENDLAVIPEKTLFSAYLGISVEVYNDLLKTSSNGAVRNLFKSIDEYFTTSQFGALINNDRKSLERIQKTETYGQEMKQTQPDNLTLVQSNQISYDDIMKSIESKRKQNVIEYADVINEK